MNKLYLNRMACIMRNKEIMILHKLTANNIGPF